MIAALMTHLCLLAALGLMAAAIAHNQFAPSFSTAMTVPIANLVSLILALLASAFAVYSHRRDPASRGTKQRMWFVIACALILAVLLPLADLGYLSRFR